MSDTLKIALLVKEFSQTGGMERYVVELAKGLRDRGHEVHIYASRADQELLPGFELHQVPARNVFSSVLKALAFARDTAKMLEGASFDIVHSHERGYRQDILTVHCFSYKEGIAKYSLLRRIDQKYLSLRGALYLWLERRQMESPWLVAVSRIIAEDIKKQYGRSANVSVIHPGADTAFFSPEAILPLRKKARAAAGYGEHELVILFVGSEFRRKGLDRLIRTIGPGMRLLVVGRGDDWPYHRQLVARHGLEKQVSFAGLASNVLPHYAAADVVALPSRSEAFGMSVLEGMACGLPVIVSDNAGVASLIRHGENGYLSHTGSELASLLGQLQNRDLRRRLGQAARVTAEDYSWGRVAALHEELYRRVVADKG